MMVQCTNFLFYLDSGLTCRNHIDYIKGKILRGICIICKAPKYLNQPTLILLYYALIHIYIYIYIYIPT